MASRSRYVPLPMIIDISEPWAPPHPFVLTGPKDWNPPVSRVIFHETVHYWQYIGHTHLIHLIEEDWARLKHFDATGEILPPGSIRRGFAQRKNRVGFSTQDLVEAHARFWDVQVLGPPLLIELELNAPNRDVSETLTIEQYEQLKAFGVIWHHFDANGRGIGYSSLSFDLAMRLSAGSYALPYLILREETNDLIAAALFPLCAHFALHSESPPDFYLELVNRLKGQLDLARGALIEQAWRSLYIDVLREAELLHIQLYDCEFFTGQATIHDSPLFHEHIGYRWAYTMLLAACGHLEKKRSSTFLIGSENMELGMRSLWTMDYLLACCGMTESRSPDLLTFIAPPIIRFTDGLTWNLGAIFDQMAFGSSAKNNLEKPPPRLEVNSTLLAVDDRWNEMLLAAL